jgi:uncharacterized membrane-anchored protein YitT (DUF2179 family)
MRSKASLVALSVAIWWVLVNLPWLIVGQEEFTGGQLIPVLNLLPAIALTALFISLYGKLRKTLLVAIALIAGVGLYVSLSADLAVSAVVIAELERLSGMLNPDSHDAGVAISEAWGKYAAIAVNSLAIVVTVIGLRSTKEKSPSSESESVADDNRSLWDEQN